MDSQLSRYFSELGRRGGRLSRRRLSREQAQQMVVVREARRAFRDFHARCFWSSDASLRITQRDVPWVADRLMRFGGRAGWERGAKLCR
jgi:hypothetical protein